MIKKMAWNTFKKTGDINTFLEYKQIQSVEKDIEQLNQQIQDIQKNANMNLENIDSGKE